MKAGAWVALGLVMLAVTSSHISADVFQDDDWAEPQEGLSLRRDVRDHRRELARALGDHKKEMREHRMQIKCESRKLGAEMKRDIEGPVGEFSRELRSGGREMREAGREMRSAGREFGHAGRDVAREFAHGVRNVVRLLVN